jgi:hypothetical protein
LIGVTLAALAAFALCALGLGALVVPAGSAGGYGIASSDPNALAFVRSTGTRDIALGAILAVLLVVGTHQLAGYVLAVCALVALGDFLIVARARGSEARTSLAVHGTGIVGCGLVAALLLNGI